MKAKHETISDMLGGRMCITEYYRCRYCRAKVYHVFRGQHLLTHVDKLYPDIYKPIKNVK